MRIIAGQYKGRRISPPPGRNTRPTTDRVRESIFSILGNINGLHVWDAFAGSGALGLEALSRGAAYTLFTDTDRQAIQSISSNVEILNLIKRTTILRTSFFSYIKKLHFSPDLIFLDPPYSSTSYEDIYKAISLSDHILPETICLFEFSSNTPISLPETFSPPDIRRYGSSSIAFTKKL